MAGLGAAADARLFGLDEVADAIVTLEIGAFAQVGEGADFGVLADDRPIRAHANLQMAPITDGDVAQPCGALDDDVGTDARVAENLHVGPDVVSRPISTVGAI